LHWQTLETVSRYLPKFDLQGHIFKVKVQIGANYEKLGLAHALSSKVNYEVKNTLFHGNISHLIIKVDNTFLRKREEK